MIGKTILLRSMYGRLSSGIQGALGSVGTIVFGAFLAANGLRLVSTVILTRILAPEAFGVIGLLSAITYFATMMSDVGFQAFVIRHADGSKNNFRDAIWTLRLVRCVILGIIVFVIARPIAELVNKPDLERPIRVFSSIFILDGLGSLALITALRDGQIMRLSLLELTATLVQLLTSVICGVLWKNYWAVLVGILAGAAWKSAFSHFVFDTAHHRFAWNPRYAKELFSFGRFIVASSVLTMLLTQGDRIYFARFFTISDLGLYTLAANLISPLTSFAGNYADRALYPVYARAMAREAAPMAQTFQAAKRRAGLGYAAAVGLVTGGSTLLIDALYDNRYRSAAFFLGWLAAAAIPVFNNLAANHFLVSAGMTSATFRVNAARVVMLLISTAALFPLTGPIALLYAYVIVEAAAQLYYWSLLRHIQAFSLYEECLPYAVALAGFGVGAITSSMWTFPY